MPLPENFSPTEHLQDVVRTVQNRIVREEFSDLGGEDWDDDITTARGSLRVACTHQDLDSIDMTLTRLWLFYGCLRKAQDFHPAIYGIPVAHYQESFKFLPQVRLYFSEAPNEIDFDYEPLRAEITFRLMGETSSSITPAKAETLATRIKTLFAPGNVPFRWKKGQLKMTYKRPEQGYHLILSPWSEADGKRVLEQVLDINSHSIDNRYLFVSKREATYPTIPPTELIYGKQRREPRRRATGNVRFRYAELKIWGMPRDITLVDLSGFRRDPLIS